MKAGGGLLGLIVLAAAIFLPRLLGGGSQPVSAPSVGGGVALGFAATFFNAAQEELSTRCRLPYSRHARITPTRLGDRGPLIGAGAIGVRGLRRDRARGVVGVSGPTLAP